MGERREGMRKATHTIKIKELEGWIVVDDMRIIWGISDQEDDWMEAYKDAVKVLDSVDTVHCLFLHKASLDLVCEVDATGGIIPWRFQKNGLAVHDPVGEPTAESIKLLEARTPA